MLIEHELNKRKEISTLKRKCENSILELKEIYKTKNIRFKRNGNTHFIGDTLNKIELSKEVMRIVLKYPPKVKKYNGVIPSNIAELLQYSGRLDQLIQRLETTLRFWNINDDLSKRYVEVLLTFIYQLNQFKSIDKKSDNYNNYNSQLPICALCYEPVKKSNMNQCYCEFHIKKNNQQRDRNALLKIIRNSETSEQKVLLSHEEKNIPIKCTTLYGFLENITPKIWFKINDNIIENLWNDDWIKYVNYFIKLIEENYPLSFNKINNLNTNDFNSYNSYMKAFEIALCNRPPVKNWLHLENNYLDIQLILAMVRRIESYSLLKLSINNE